MHFREAIRPIFVFCAAMVLFLWLAASIEMRGVTNLADAWVADWLHVRVWPPVTTVMIAISFLGAPSTITVVTLVACLPYARARSFERLILVLTLVVGGNLLNNGLKALFHRGRPVFDDPLLILPSYSFPSGHAMAATVFYGFVVGVLLSNGPRVRPAAIVAGFLMIFLVGFSRVYLGVHYPSDVLAGILEAIAWSSLVLALWRFTLSFRENFESRRRPN